MIYLITGKYKKNHKRGEIKTMEIQMNTQVKYKKLTPQELEQAFVESKKLDEQLKKEEEERLAKELEIQRQLENGEDLNILTLNGEVIQND